MKIERRKFLRGLGVGLALPGLEALALRRAIAASGPGLATTASGMPLRMGFLYVPNGVIMPEWFPKGTGKEFEFNKSTASLAPFRDHLQFISGFEHKNGWAGPDGAGDHARANATILTGARPRKTAGADIKLGVSVDQVAAAKVGSQSRFSSLELSCDGVRKSGVCDSGYSCAYQFNLSWRSETTPMAPESNPRLVFERLFGAGKGEERQKNFQIRQAQKRSILDFILDDAKSLQTQLGRNDQHKLDEYLTGVREIEQRIQKAEKFGRLPDPGMDTPSGVPENYKDHIRLMMDMLLLAFETDSTRVATFLMAYDGSNRTFKDIGISEGHHSLSHHQDDADKVQKLAAIDTFYCEQFAYFLERLAQAKDPDGSSVLDNSMLVYCSGLSDGNRHRHNNLPVILAGHGGGNLQTGRHLQLSGDTPMSNLYVHMLNRIGVKDTSFGDSTGAFTDV